MLHFCGNEDNGSISQQRYEHPEETCPHAVLCRGRFRSSCSITVAMKITVLFLNRDMTIPQKPALMRVAREACVGASVKNKT